jgi:hypothetical protein
MAIVAASAIFGVKEKSGSSTRPLNEDSGVDGHEVDDGASTVSIA